MLSLLSPDDPNTVAYRQAINTLIAQPGNGNLGSIEFAVTADATAGLNLPATTFPFKIVAVQVTCDATNASGTLTLRSGTNAISSAMTCAALDAVAVSTSTITAYRVVPVGTVLNVISIGGTTASTRGTVLITVERQ